LADVQVAQELLAAVRAEALAEAFVFEVGVGARQRLFLGGLGLLDVLELGSSPVLFFLRRRLVRGGLAQVRLEGLEAVDAVRGGRQVAGRAVQRYPGRAGQVVRPSLGVVIGPRVL